MAWENNSERNGDYEVIHRFQIFPSRVVVPGGTKPMAEFGEDAVVRIRHDGFDHKEGPTFDIRPASQSRVSASINRYNLEKLIEMGVLKKKD